MESVKQQLLDLAKQVRPPRGQLSERNLALNAFATQLEGLAAQAVGIDVLHPLPVLPQT
jgi:hypothetical protein